MSLRKRALKGGSVALAGFAAGQGLRLVSNLVMTRLLAPDAFGLMAIAFAVQTWIAMMTDLGLDANIVRSKNGERPEFLATARTLQLARNALIALFIVVIAAGLPALVDSGAARAGTVFADPRLPAFLHLIALSVVISGLSAMRVALYNRALNLAPLIRLELGSQILSMAAMILAALAGAGAYSLAIGGVAAAALKSAGSYVLLKGPPARFGFHRESFDEIIGYGKWLIIASTFGFLISRGDQIIFGWLLDAGEYSLYAIATIWIVAGRNVVDTVQRRVAYPVFSEIHRDRPQDMTGVYRKMRLAYDAGAVALFLAAVFGADPLVSLLYTDEYSRVSHYIRLGSIFILSLPYRLLATVTLSGGDSREFTLVTIAPGVVLFGLTPFIFDRFGADAAIVFASLAHLVAVPFSWRTGSKFVKIDYVRESALLVVAAVAAIWLVFWR